MTLFSKRTFSAPSPSSVPRSSEQSPNRDDPLSASVKGSCPNVAPSLSDTLRMLFTRENLLTVPNLLTLIRIFLIPAIVYSFVRERYLLSAVLIALSGITDIADGRLARSLGMVSDLGKVFDPVADKLTQAALLLCVLRTKPALLPLFLLFLFKEGIQAFTAIRSVSRTGRIIAARWYGKASTVILYLVMLVFFLFPSFPKSVEYLLAGISGSMLLVSLIGYLHYFRM